MDFPAWSNHSLHQLSHHLSSPVSLKSSLLQRRNALCQEMSGAWENSAVDHMDLVLVSYRFSIGEVLQELDVKPLKAHLSSIQHLI